MQILSADKALDADTAVCLGYFDGVHLGHARLLSLTAERAKEFELTPCAHTFDRSPAAALQGRGNVLELTNLSEKARLMEALGIRILAVSAFTEALMRMPGKRFFEEIVLGKLRARHVVAGFHHRFGANGDTDADMLCALCRENGITCDIVAPVRLVSGELISSSAIRTALASGDTQKADAMLGRPWRG